MVAVLDVMKPLRGPKTSVRTGTLDAVDALLALAHVAPREGTVLVAEEGSEVVGVALMHLSSPDAELLALVTDPLHRHRGVARALLHEARLRAKRAGCTRIRVRVSRADDGHAAFFRALGFEETHLAFDLPL